MDAHLLRLPCLALALLLAAPSIAGACPIPWRVVGPVKVERLDIRRPVTRTVPRARWGLDASWASTQPELNQQVVTSRGRVYESVSFARQRVIGIDAAAPDSNGWVYGDDDDPATRACAISGQPEWQQPVIRVRQGRRVVRIAAAARRTVGDRTGCVLGGGQDASDWGCPTLTRTVIRLGRPLGGRLLVFEAFR